MSTQLTPPHHRQRSVLGPAPLQLEGVLLMDGEGEPAELADLIRDLRTSAEDLGGTGDWLANALQASWDIAAGPVHIRGLEDRLGDRHRIIANDWLASDAGVSSVNECSPSPAT